MKTYQIIARTLGALRRCEQTPDSHAEWIKRHSDRLDELVEDFPHGSGFDNATVLDLNASTPERLVFNTAFHHMNEDGYYDGWTDHSVIVTSSLEMGYKLRITGRNRNDIKDLIADRFREVLDNDEPEYKPATPIATA